MADERSYKKPLIIGGIAAVAGVGWLAHGVHRGKGMPKNRKEALALFRDPTDPLKEAKAKVMGELLARTVVSSDELVVRLTDPEESPEMALRKLLRTMAALGRATLGEWAFARLASDVHGIGHDSISAYSYKATDVAHELYDTGQLPELIVPPSDNS